MALNEVLTYIEQNILPEQFLPYDNDMRNYALVANGITYMQRSQKDKKYLAPSNVATVADGAISWKNTGRAKRKLTNLWKYTGNKTKKHTSRESKSLPCSIYLKFIKIFFIFSPFHAIC